MTNTRFYQISTLPSGDKILHLLCCGVPLQELTQALNQALNCRPEAPKWLHDMANEINDVPEPHNARTNGKTT
jgi:hypothetical protein